MQQIGGKERSLLVDGEGEEVRRKGWREEGEMERGI